MKWVFIYDTYKTLSNIYKILIYLTNTYWLKVISKSHKWENKVQNNVYPFIVVVVFKEYICIYAHRIYLGTYIGNWWGFPGGSGAKTPHFQCKRPEFHPW